MTTPSMMAGVQADLAALKARIAEMMGDWVAYEKIGGRCSVVFRGTRQDCHAYVFDHPTGPNGGSTHIAHRPRRPIERDQIACIRPRTLAPVRSLLATRATTTPGD